MLFLFCPVMLQNWAFRYFWPDEPNSALISYAFGRGGPTKVPSAVPTAIMEPAREPGSAVKLKSRQGLIFRLEAPIVFSNGEAENEHRHV